MTDKFNHFFHRFECLLYCQIVLVAMQGNSFLTNNVCTQLLKQCLAFVKHTFKSKINEWNGVLYIITGGKSKENIR